MRPADRVRAALALERPERPPASWWGHTYREEWSSAELASVTISRARTYGWDFVKIQPRACCFAQTFGCEYRADPDFRRAPVQVRPAVTDPGGWSAVPAVDPATPSLQDQVETVGLVARALGPSVPVIQTVFSPLTVAGYLRGEDKALTAHELREHPGALGPALERIAATLADFAARSVAAGAAGIFFANSGYASSDLLALETYEELALPHDRSVLEAVADAWFNVLHLCGPRIQFPLASALDVHAVSWSVHEPGTPSLAEGRTQSGRAVMGGVSHLRTMVRGTPPDVVAEVRAAVDDADGTGLLVAPGCSVPPEAPEANLRALSSADPG